MYIAGGEAGGIDDRTRFTFNAISIFIFGGIMLLGCYDLAVIQ